MPWIDLSTTSLWIDYALTWSNLQKTSMQLLGVLCWLFRGTVSTFCVCQSIFLYAALQSAPRPFDPSPKPPEAARYWSDNGPEWYSWPPLRGTLLAPNTHPVEMSQFTSVSISASVFGFVLFVSDKSGCLFSFCSLSKESFPSRNYSSDNINKLTETRGVEFVCLWQFISAANIYNEKNPAKK